MKICTLKLSEAGPTNVVILASMNVVQFQVLCQSSSGAATILGDGTVMIGTSGTAYTNQAQPLSSGQGYNSAQADPRSPWDGVTIVCTGGTVDVTLTTD